MICTIVPTYALEFADPGAQLKLPPIHFDIEQGYTLEAMVRFATLERGACIFELSNDRSGDDVILLHARATRDLVIELGPSAASCTVIAPGVLEPEAWMHIAVTVAGNGQTTLYKNGQAVKVGMLPVTTAGPRQDNFVGTSGARRAAPFSGHLAEVRIWNYVRNGAQLAQAIGRLSAPERTDLLHYFPLDDGAGDRPRDLAATTAHSASQDGAVASGTRWFGAHASDDSLAAQSAERRVYWQIFLDGSFSASGHFHGSRVLPAGRGCVIIERAARNDSLWRLGYTYDEAGNVAAFFCRDDSLPASVSGAALRVPFDSGLLSRAALPQPGHSDIRVGAAHAHNRAVDWHLYRDDPKLVEDLRPPALSNRIFPDGARPAPSLGMASRLGFQDGSFTVEAWLRGCDLDPSCEYAVLGNDSATEPLHFMIRGLRTGMRIGRRELVGTTALHNGKWHHLAWSYDRAAQKMSLFVDGVRDAVAAAAPFFGSGAISLGSYRGARALGPRRPFHGNLDEVRIFARARSPVELRADRGRRLSGAESGLSAVYRIDEQADQALEFFGTPALGHIARPVAGNVELTSMHIDFAQGLTVEAWVHYRCLKPWARILDLGNGPSSNNIVLASGDSGGDLALLIYVGGISRQLLAVDALPIGEWMHLAATVDSDGNGKLYKNGELLAAGELAVPANVPRSSNFIGKSNWSGDAPFSGMLSEVRLWNRARSPEALRRDQHRRLGGSEVGLCGNWRLDEGCGPVAKDASPCGHDGRLQPGTESRASGLLLGAALPAGSVTSFSEPTDARALPGLAIDCEKRRLPATRSVLGPRPPRAGSHRRTR